MVKKKSISTIQDMFKPRENEEVRNVKSLVEWSKKDVLDGLEERFGSKIINSKFVKYDEEVLKNICLDDREWQDKKLITKEKRYFTLMDLSEIDVNQLLSLLENEQNRIDVLKVTFCKQLIDYVESFYYFIPPREYLHQKYIETLVVTKKITGLNAEKCEKLINILAKLYSCDSKYFYIDTVVQSIASEYFRLNLGHVENTDSAVYMTYLGTTYIYEDGDMYVLEWMDYDTLRPRVSGYYYVKVCTSQVHLLYYETRYDCFIEDRHGQVARSILDSDIIACSTLEGVEPIDIEEHLSHLNYDYIS